CQNSSALKYVVRAQDLGHSVAITNNDPVTGIPVVCSAGAAANNVVAVQQALGRSLTGNGTTIQDSTYNDCRNIAATVLIPSIACTKQCSNGVGEGGSITFLGTVSNTSSNGTTLFGVTVSNLVNGTLTLVTNISSLTAGATASFGGS